MTKVRNIAKKIILTVILGNFKAQKLINFKQNLSFKLIKNKEI
jgi:hypothetical protein